MQVQNGSVQYPLSLIVLDMIGAALIGVGLFEWNAGPEFMPLAWRFEHYPIVMIGLGFALMLPLFFFFIRKIRRQRENLSNTRWSR